MRVIHGRKVTKGKARGEALVTSEPICYLGGIDVKTGVVTEVGHELEGKSIAGKILVFPTGKGSTGGSYLIYEAKMNNKGPVAMVNLEVEPVTAIGCIMAEIPLVDRPEVDVCREIKTGMMLEVDGDAGTVTILD